MNAWTNPRDRAETETRATILDERFAAFREALDGFVPSPEQRAAATEEAVMATHEKIRAGGATIRDFDYGACLAWHGIGVRELLKDFLPDVATCPEIVRGYHTYWSMRGREISK